MADIKKPEGTAAGGEGGGGGGGEDDWAAAVDEWTNTLNLPVAKPEATAASAPATAPAPISDEKTPVPGLDEGDAGPLRSDEKTPVPGEPLPISALDVAEGSLPALPMIHQVAEDPLKGLLDGDLELPEVPGEALGSLLGDRHAPEEEGRVIFLDEEEDEPTGRLPTPLPGGPKVNNPDEFNLDWQEPAELGTIPPGPSPLGRQPAIAAHEIVLPDEIGDDMGDIESVEVKPARSAGLRERRPAPAPEVLARLKSALESMPEPDDLVAHKRPAAVVPSRPTPATTSSDDDYDDIVIEAAETRREPAAAPEPELARAPDFLADDLSAELRAEAAGGDEADPDTAPLTLPTPVATTPATTTPPPETATTPATTTPAVSNLISADERTMISTELPAAVKELLARRASQDAPPTTTTTPPPEATVVTTLDPVVAEATVVVAVEPPATKTAEPPAAEGVDVFDFNVDLDATLLTRAAPAAPPPTIIPAAYRVAQPLAPPRKGQLVDQPAPAPLLPTEVSPPLVTVVDRAPVALEPSAFAAQAALLDGERQLCGDTARCAQLAYAAGRAAERAGDPDGAWRRYEAALDADAGFVSAMRALRRLALVGGRPDVASDFLEREIERSTSRERLGLIGLRGDVLLAGGAPDAARFAYAAVIAERPHDLRVRSGMVDVATAGGDQAELRQTLTDLVALVEPRDRAVASALHTEIARLDELAGDDVRAAAGYQSALGDDATTAQLGAALGALRVALRGESAGALLLTHRKLAPLLDGGLRQAVDRRMAALELGGGLADVAAATLRDASDGPSLSLRATAEDTAGQGAAAAATLERLAQLEQGPRRAEVLLRLGELHEKLGGHIDAAHAFDRAAEAAPDDVRASRAVLRASRARGDVDRLVSLARADAARDPARAEAAQLRVARLLVDQGRGDEAVAALELALAASPQHPGALGDLVAIHLAADRPADAAAALQRAADAQEEPEQSTLLRDRAARLYARAGDVPSAILLLHQLRDGALGLPSIWLEQRLLGAVDDPGIAEALATEAETSPDPARAAHLWSWRGAVLEPADLTMAIESHRRALSLLPGYPAAVLALQLSSATRNELADVVALEHSRVEAAAARPEAVGLRLRLGQLHDLAGDPAAALQVLNEAAAAVPAESETARDLEHLLVDVARRAGDHARVAEVLQRVARALPDGPHRFAQLLQVAEMAELRLGQVELAAEHFALAHTFRGGPLAAQGLMRTAKALGRFNVLADLARADLAEASDVERRVSAYERLLVIEGEYLGDLALAEQHLQGILALDHAHSPSFRALERIFIRSERWAELVAIYEQIGLTAGDPAFSVAVLLDLARLRERLGASDPRAIENDLRMALFRDGKCRPALRRVLGSARAAGDAVVLAELSGRLAESETEPRAAAIFAARAGEALEELGRTDEAIARYRGAIQHGKHLPAMRALGRLALHQSNYREAAFASFSAGHVLRDPAERTRAYLLAGVVAQDHLSDVAAALEAFRSVLAADPRNRDAFERLRALLEGMDDSAGLARVLSARIDVETDPARLVALHLEISSLYRDRLGNRDFAKQHLRRLLGIEANHVGALLALSDLHYVDQQWPEAAEILIRRARIEKDPQVLKDVFFKLGLIYDERTPDTKRAVVSFTRVLQFDPENRVALEHLSNLQMKEGEWKGALAATSRLAELEPDAIRKVQHLHRVAKIYEEGLKDARAAHDAFRRAVDVDLKYLPAIGELARFYERQGDLTSARVQLDRSVQATRAQVMQNPTDPVPLHSLFQIFSWRRSFDQALTVAQILKSTNQANAEEQAHLQRFGKDGYPGTALAAPDLDDSLFVSNVPSGFRHMFRLLDEPLQKAFRGDLKQLGIGKHEKLPRQGHAVRDVANRIAADLGIRDFDVYVTAAQPRTLAIELTDPISIVLGTELCAGIHEHELRFFLGRSLKMIQVHMAVPLRLRAEELGVLVGSIVRQFVPDFVPRGFDEASLVVQSGRVAKVIPRKVLEELRPFAYECANPDLDLRALAAGLLFTANRAGVLAAGSVPPALSALRRLGDESQVRELLRTAISDELTDLRRLVGTAIG